MDAKEFKQTKEFKELQLVVNEAKEKNDSKALAKVKKQLKSITVICGAITGKGKICVRTPFEKEDGSTNGRCQLHGGNSTGQKTKEGKARSLANLSPQANLIHGVYTKDFNEKLTQEEIELYTYFMNYFTEDLGVNDPINLVLCQRFVINLLKQMRLETANFTAESKSYNDFDAKIIRFVESLGLNKKFQDSKDHKDNDKGVNLNMLFDMGNDQE
ncbi:hypothetical protein CBR56_07710 [Bacillus thuringiensis]|uniref:HGGxSTG domain-containing protein n=1 Tax=Bacillus tropicus TaxID=2026188 RepID=UPI000B43E12B|nr:HGGxSTG domain-containing protein [Bacillus tropicus]MED3037258.1 HGGxSTG domain-containing protein [Bacillus tropicus]OTX85110.1 hypothetical protein BK728_10810 [Bacillus thuringiensis serovar chanpaisis]PNK31480.1 hypothetical protein CBR56_07710 [Bacillus thuringiensis]